MLNCIRLQNSKTANSKFYEHFRVLNQSDLSDCTQEILLAFREIFYFPVNQLKGTFI